MRSNKAMHPTVSGATPLAKGGKRRATQPAGDGRRWADDIEHAYQDW